MQDEIGAVDRLLHGGRIAEVALDDLDLAIQAQEVLPPAGGEIVQDPDAFPPADQFVDEVRPDESRASRHQIGCHLPPRWRPPRPVPLRPASCFHTRVGSRGGEGNPGNSGWDGGKIQGLPGGKAWGGGSSAILSDLPTDQPLANRIANPARG